MTRRIDVRALVRTLCAAFRLQIQLSLATPNYVAAVFLHPAVLAVLTGLVFMLTGKPERIAEYAVIGAGMFGVWSSNLHASMGIIQGERRYGTLEFLAATPVPLSWIVLGKVLAASCFSLLSIIVSTSVVAVAFHSPLRIADEWVLVLSILASVSSVAVVGLLLSTVFIATRHYYRVADFLYLVFVLSGLVFPVDLLPLPIRPLSYALPITWSAAALRAAFGGTGASKWPHYILGSVVVTAAYLVLALKCYRVVMEKLRREARLGRY